MTFSKILWSFLSFLYKLIFHEGQHISIKSCVPFYIQSYECGEIFRKYDLLHFILMFKLVFVRKFGSYLICFIYFLLLPVFYLYSCSIKLTYPINLICSMVHNVFIEVFALFQFISAHALKGTTLTAAVTFAQEVAFGRDCKQKCGFCKKEKASTVRVFARPSPPPHLLPTLLFILLLLGTSYTPVCSIVSKTCF